jgi:hypothetical protein
MCFAIYEIDAQWALLDELIPAPRRREDRPKPSLERPQIYPERHIVGTAYRCPLGRPPDRYPSYQPVMVVSAMGFTEERANFPIGHPIWLQS